MKKLINVILCAMLLLNAFAFTAFAAVPDNAVAAYGTADIDGKASAGEWDNAAEWVITPDNGTPVGGNAELLTAELSKITYKFMYDENNFYILETRECDEFRTANNADTDNLWQGDSTLFFLSYNDVVIDIQFTADTLGDTGAKINYRLLAEGEVFEYPVNAKIVSSNAKKTIELSVPWSEIHLDAPKADTSGQISPIICKQTSGGQSQYNTSFLGGTDFGTKLTFAAPVVETQPEQTEAPAEVVTVETAAPVIAPQTSDIGFTAAIVTAAFALFIITRKKQ